MKKTLLHLCGYLVFGAACFWAGALTRDYLVTKDRAEARQRPSRFLAKVAPAVRSQTLQSDSWVLAEQKGKVVVLEFWATWCGPCMAALPELKALDAEFSGRSDFALFGVSIDANVETVRASCLKNAVKWTQLFEPNREWDNSIAKAFEVRGVPFVCVLDKRGVVRYYDGRTIDGDARDIRSLIKKLLSES